MNYDIEYNDGPALSYAVGDSRRTLNLPSAQSYSSFILLPLLTFATRRKCLFIGGPGRGKTASALLMGVLAGAPVRDVKPAMQHGHPQMMIADLLGNPLPADLINAQSMDDIRIAWRSWLGCQTLNGISVRTLMSLLVYAKALAWFRGNDAVELDDVRQVLPFVLHNKLQPDIDAPFFALPENAAYRSDRLSWLRRLFDLSNDEFNRLDLDRNDPVGDLSVQFDLGLDGVSERETLARLTKIERLIGERIKGRKLYGLLYDDLLKLKYLHQRYTNYRVWLRSPSA